MSTSSSSPLSARTVCGLLAGIRLNNVNASSIAGYLVSQLAEAPLILDGADEMIDVLKVRAGTLQAMGNTRASDLLIELNRAVEEMRKRLITNAPMLRFGMPTDAALGSSGAILPSSRRMCDPMFQNHGDST